MCSILKASVLLSTYFVGLRKSFLSVVENPGGKHGCVFVPGLGDYTGWRTGFGSYSGCEGLGDGHLVCVCVCVCVGGWQTGP